MKADPSPSSSPRRQLIDAITSYHHAGQPPTPFVSSTRPINSRHCSSSSSSSPIRSTTTFDLHNHKPLCEILKQHCTKKKSKRISLLNSPPQIIGPFVSRSPLLAKASPSTTHTDAPHRPRSPHVMQLNNRVARRKWFRVLGSA
jgi:hypothetical protein